MTNNFLCLNDEKTEVLLIASKTNQKKLDISSVHIGDTQITPVNKAKNIGFIFDSLMDGKAQIQNICKSGWYQLNRIVRIRDHLDRKSTEMLIQAFVTSRLDVNNSLLLGLPKTLLKRIQILQNAAARVVMRLPKRAHITGTLMELHWLPIQYRIDYKIVLLVFKALHDLAPDYISDLLELKDNRNHNLRSNVQRLLVVPKSKRKSISDRNFAVMAPSLWNSLPDDIRCCDKLEAFKKLLKTFLFKEAYC